MPVNPADNQNSSPDEPKIIIDEQSSEGDTTQEPPPPMPVSTPVPQQSPPSSTPVQQPAQQPNQQPNQQPQQNPQPQKQPASQPQQEPPKKPPPEPTQKQPVQKEEVPEEPQPPKEEGIRQFEELSDMPTERERSGGKLKLLIIPVIIILLAAGAYYYISKSNAHAQITTTIPVSKFSYISSCANITSPGTYIITGNITTSKQSGACIEIQSNNVKLEGDSHALVGDGPYIAKSPYTYGIAIVDSSNVSISKLNISKFSYDLYLSAVLGSSFSNITATNSTVSGAYVLNSKNNLLLNDQVYSSGTSAGGLNLIGGGNNTVKESSLSHNAYYGLNLSSTGNKFLGDVFASNPVDLYCASEPSRFRYSNKFIGTQCSTNDFCNSAYCAVSNKQFNVSENISLSSSASTCGEIRAPGNYLVSQNLNLSSYINTSRGATGIACITIASPNVNLNCGGHTVSNSGYGIYAKNVYNFTITDCRFNNDSDGVYLADSLDFNVTNSAAYNSTVGLYAGLSDIGTIANSTFGNDFYGVYVSNSSNLVFNRINAKGNNYGIYNQKLSNTEFYYGNFSHNTKSDFYCSAVSYNSTTNHLSNAACGLTDCNWGKASCKYYTLPPVAAFPISACTSITTPGSYALTKNIITPGTCMSIDTNNVTFSCAGHILDGTGPGSGIYMNHRVGVSIENCSIEGFTFGINLTNSAAITLQDVTSNGTGVGIYASNVSSSLIENTTAYASKINGEVYNRLNSSIITGNGASFGAGNSTGIVFRNSSNNEISLNNASSNANSGFSFYNSTGNYVLNNTAFSNKGYDYFCSPDNSGLYAENGGINNGLTKHNCEWLAEVSPESQSQLCSAINTATHVSLSYDMYYPYGSKCYSITNINGSVANYSSINCNGHTVIATNGGVFAYSTVSNVKVENCYLKGFTSGIVLKGNNDQVLNNVLGTSNYSISVSGKGTSVLNNTIKHSIYGIYLSNASLSTVKDNLVGNTSYSISVSNATLSTIQNNTVVNSTTRYSPISTAVGISVYNITRSSILNNRVSGNATIGVRFSGSSILNTFTNNTASGTVSGIACYNSSSASSSDYDFGGNICSNNSCQWMTKSPLCRYS